MTGEHFEVRVESAFRASHVRDPRGEVAAAHAHDWQVAVHARSTGLDAIAIVVDFRRLRADTDRVLSQLEGTRLEEHPQLGGHPVTALEVGRWLLERMQACAEGESWEVFAVEVECDPGVRYVVESGEGD